MNCNFAIFPAPSFNRSTLLYLKNYLFFIPKPNPSNVKETIYIPCLFFQKQGNELSPNFLIMFHGNAEDIFDAKIMADELLKFLPMNIIIVEYPGYSIYDLPKSSETIKNDAEYIYDYIKNEFKVNDNNMFVFGRSIGTGPAIHLASRRFPSALFVVSAFSSIVEVAKNIAGILGNLVYNAFPSLENIKNITCPILFIHGMKDPLIPVEETIKLKNSCNCPCEMLLPPNMTHNDFYFIVDIAEPIQRFIKKHCVIEQTKLGFKFDTKLFKIPPQIEKNLKEKSYGA